MDTIKNEFTQLKEQKVWGRMSIIEYKFYPFRVNIFNSGAD